MCNVGSQSPCLQNQMIFRVENNFEKFNGVLCRQVRVEEALASCVLVGKKSSDLAISRCTFALIVVPVPFLGRFAADTKSSLPLHRSDVH